MSLIPRSSGYRRSFKQFGESPQAMQWSSYRAAAIRYRHLVENIDIENKTILDAGCGMGDLLPYLYAKSDNFDYLGVDVMPEFIKVAAKRYSGHQFRVADPFAGELGHIPRFDVVLSSGVMNANVADWMTKRQQMITALYKLTKKTLVFNMAGSTPAPKFSPRSRVAYADAEEVAAFCKTLTSKVKLDTSYHHNDFTIRLDT